MSKPTPERLRNLELVKAGALRSQRILNALERGEKAKAIVAREGVTRAWVTYLDNTRGPKSRWVDRRCAFCDVSLAGLARNRVVCSSNCRNKRDHKLRRERCGAVPGAPRRYGGPPRNELAGKRFGRWFVLDKYRPGQDQSGWLCICSCDWQTVSWVPTRNLMSGRSTNCGCAGRWGRPMARTYGTPSQEDIAWARRQPRPRRASLATH